MFSRRRTRYYSNSKGWNRSIGPWISTAEFTSWARLVPTPNKMLWMHVADVSSLASPNKRGQILLGTWWTKLGKEGWWRWVPTWAENHNNDWKHHNDFEVKRTSLEGATSTHKIPNKTNWLILSNGLAAGRFWTLWPLPLLSVRKEWVQQSKCLRSNGILQNMKGILTDSYQISSRFQIGTWLLPGLVVPHHRSVQVAHWSKTNIFSHWWKVHYERMKDTLHWEDGTLHGKGLHGAILPGEYQTKLFAGFRAKPQAGWADAKNPSIGCEAPGDLFKSDIRGTWRWNKTFDPQAPSVSSQFPCFPSSQAKGQGKRGFHTLLNLKPRFCADWNPSSSKVWEVSGTWKEWVIFGGWFP